MISVDRFKKNPSLWEAVEAGLAKSKTYPPEHTARIVFEHVRAITALHFAEAKIGKRAGTQQTLMRLFSTLTTRYHSPTLLKPSTIHFVDDENTKSE